MNRTQKKIYTQLCAKTDEELIDIWQENDEEAWVPEAFKIVEQILQERGVDYLAADAQEDLEDQDQQLTAAADPDARPALTSSSTILKIARVAKILSWVLLAGWVLLVPLSNILQGYPLAYVTATFISSLAQGALYFFLLQLLGEGIYLLVRIEHNTGK